LYCPYKKEDLIEKEIEDFWPGVIAYGFPAYVNGPTGLGKTNVFLKVGADATRGIFEPGVKDGYLAEPVKAEPIRMFYVSTENPVCEIVYPALLYNGADESMFKIQKEEDGHFELNTDDLQAVMDDFGPRLIIVDAFQEHLPNGYNLSDAGSMSELMRIWENFAYKYKVALVLIGNDSKGTEGRSDANKMLGSGVIARRARTLITVKESGHEKYLQVTKRLGFKKKEDTKIGFRFGVNERLEFYAYDSQDGDEDEIDRFIRETLTEGQLQNDKITQMAEQRGYSYKQIHSRAERMGVEIKRGKGNKTIWRLKKP